MKSGQVLLAATPIGNIGDASPRLLQALANSDIIAAEDTRRTRSLASALGVEIQGRIVSFFEHNEDARSRELVERIREGATVCVVTDAGMPSVSDPGYRLVAACIEAELPVSCLPGPSAVTTALVLSGMPVDRFCFDGFAPRKTGARRTWLGEYRTEQRTAVFFESPHRIADTLKDAAEVLGAERPAAVCRELTKTYEEVRRGELGELAEWAKAGVRGEIVVVISGAPSRDDQATLAELIERVEACVAAGDRLKDACSVVAEGSSVSRRELYEAVIAARV